MLKKAVFGGALLASLLRCRAVRIESKELEGLEHLPGQDTAENLDGTAVQTLEHWEGGNSTGSQGEVALNSNSSSGSGSSLNGTEVPILLTFDNVCGAWQGVDNRNNAVEFWLGKYDSKTDCYAEKNSGTANDSGSIVYFRAGKPDGDQELHPQDTCTPSFDGETIKLAWGKPSTSLRPYDLTNSSEEVGDVSQLTVVKQPDGKFNLLYLGAEMQQLKR